MEKVDYESAWKELKEKIELAILDSSSLGSVWRDLDSLLKKHTRWEPLLGEWVKSYDGKPYRITDIRTWGKNCWHCSFAINEGNAHVSGSDLESTSPLDEQEIKEYGGFKVGDHVIAENDIWEIEFFKFDRDEDAAVAVRNESNSKVYYIRDIRPASDLRLNNLRIIVLPDAIHVADLDDSESIEIADDEIEEFINKLTQLKRIYFTEAH